jgi:hypothetical protein
MQVHWNDQPGEVAQFEGMQGAICYVLRKWTESTRSAELWECGMCKARFMRLPMPAYQFVVVSWSDGGRGFVNVYDEQIAPAFQSGEIRLV